MFILGLTGSIGMGKSETAQMFRDRRVPVFDADAEVRELTAPGGEAFAMLANAFPETIRESGLDRARLSQIVFADEEKRKRLEALIHPLVQRAERQFLRAAGRKGKDLVVLDIPLLFETNSNRRCKATCVVTAPRAVQMARVLKREGMTRGLFESIEKTQMPDREKHSRADYIIDTGSSLQGTRRAVYRLLYSLKRKVRSRQRRMRSPGKPAGMALNVWNSGPIL